MRLPLPSLYVTSRVSVPVFPAASRAVTVIVLVPFCRVMPLTFHELVPLAVPLPPSEFDHVTCVTPVLSEAVPPRLSVALAAP